MPDETPAQKPELPKRRKTPPVEQRAGQSSAAPQWLRYTGQGPAVFIDLGGEIEPGQAVRPRDAALEHLLLTRGDFEPADAPSDADSGTTN